MNRVAQHRLVPIRIGLRAGLQSVLVAIVGLSSGCMTPELWKGATTSEIRARRIVGFVGPDARGGGRALVVEYSSAAGLFPPRGYVVVPVDAEWRATGAIALREWEGQTPRTLHERYEVRTTTQPAPANLIAANEAAAQTEWSGPGGKPAFRYHAIDPGQTGTFRVARTDAAIFFFEPPDESTAFTDQKQPSRSPTPPILRQADPNVSAPRWVAVPRSLDRPLFDRMGAAAAATLATPFTLVYDATVVPVTMAIVLIEYERNAPR